jgi:hypothetical protein
LHQGSVFARLVDVPEWGSMYVLPRPSRMRPDGLAAIGAWFTVRFHTALTVAPGIAKSVMNHAFDFARRERNVL